MRRLFSASGKAGWFFYLFIRTTIRLVVYRYFRVNIIGREHLLTEGALIIAPSHRSNLDAPLTGAVPPWRVRSLSKESLFKNPVLRWVVTALGSFPVKRGTADREAMRTAEALLSSGENVLVFPEGTRQSGNTINNVFDGTAYLAARGGAKIVPIGLYGTEAAMPPGGKFPRRSTVTIVVGAPIPTQMQEGRVRRKELGPITERLTSELQAAYDMARKDAISRGGK